MGAGLQIFNAAGALTFDSAIAVGGICVGIRLIPSGGASYAFPIFAGRTGFALAVDGSRGIVWSVSYAAGYPIFYFGSYAQGYRIVMYIV